MYQYSVALTRLEVPVTKSIDFPRHLVEMLLLKLSILHGTLEDTACSHVSHVGLKVKALMSDKVTRLSKAFEVSRYIVVRSFFNRTVCWNLLLGSNRLHFYPDMI